MQTISATSAPKSKIHIGHIIEEFCKTTNITAEDFVHKLKMKADRRTYAYRIFRSSSLSTKKLQQISAALSHNFFNYFMPVTAANGQGVADLRLQIEKTVRGEYEERIQKILTSKHAPITITVTLTDKQQREIIERVLSGGGGV